MKVTRYTLAPYFEAEHGFNPRGIYCQFTGKQIGWTDSDEFDCILDSLMNRNDDMDAVCDDLAIRIFASMRPSLLWNAMRADSLEQMRTRNPIDTLAYLVNRLFAPLDSTHLGMNERLGFMGDRIKAHKLITQWDVCDSTNTMLYLLLELDAKWGLQTEVAPFTAYDFFVDCPTHAHRLEMLVAWHERRMKAWDVKQAQDELSSRFHRSGNPLAKPAFFAAFMESRPPSKTATEKQHKKAERDLFAGLLAEVMGKPTLAGVEQAPRPVVAKAVLPNVKMPMRFGMKKDS